MTGKACAQAVASAVQAGYRHIDTAAMYGNEEAVGEGIRRSGVARDEIFLTTKVWSSDIGDGDLQRTAEASLARLGVDVVDLLLIHWPNSAIPMAESIGALCDAKTRGFARHIGVSNFTTAMMGEAWAHSTEPLVCNQVEYHPKLDQGAIYADCRRRGMALVSYCPLGRGEQGGLFSDPVVLEIARRIGKTPGQVVLRWHVQQPGVVAIPKSANPARQAENLAVFDFALDDDAMQRLTGLSNAAGRVVNPASSPAWD